MRGDFLPGAKPSLVAGSRVLVPFVYVSAMPLWVYGGIVLATRIRILAGASK
jgi:hypothetical protein